MKILLLCNKMPYPANDGSSIAIARMIEGYLKTGSEVTVLSLNTKKHRKEIGDIPLEISSKVKFHVVEVDTNPTTGKAFVNLFQKMPFHVSRFFQKKVAHTLQEILTNQNFDVIQFEGVFMMPYVHVASHYSKAKVVLRAHNVEHEIWERASKPNKKPILKAFLKNQTRKLKRYERFCASRADAVFAITQKDAQFFEELNPLTIVVPVGINEVSTVEFSARQAFFHLGAMDWMPNKQGVEWLLKEVWPKVHQQNKNLVLHLAGRTLKKDDPDYKKAGVVVHGEIADAIDFRKNHGIMVVPLQAGSGMRVKIIEAMAEEIAIITTPVGCEGIPLINGQHALIAETPKDFAQAMISLAAHADEQKSMAREATKLAQEQFLNTNILKKVLLFYADTWKIS